MPRYGTARRLPRRRGAPFRQRPTPMLDAPDEGGLGASSEARGVPGGLWGRAYGSAGCRTRCRARCRGKGCCLGRLTNNQPDIVVGLGEGRAKTSRTPFPDPRGSLDAPRMGTFDKPAGGVERGLSRQPRPKARVGGRPVSDILRRGGHAVAVSTGETSNE